MEILVADSQVDKEAFPRLVPCPVPSQYFSPMVACLLRLAPLSQLTMAKLLRRLVEILGSSVPAEEFLWSHIDYGATFRPRQALASRHASITGDVALSALRGVLREALRLGRMSYVDLRRTSDLSDLPGDRCAYSAGVQGVGWNTTISSIVFPEKDHLRSRKVVSRSRSRPTGKYPSWKMRRMVHWESENELNAFRLLDCDPDVTSYHEQPCKVEFVQDGLARSHYPDILVKKNGRKELWEVKNEAQAEESEVVTRTTLLIQGLPLWGYAYRVVLAKDLAMQPRQRNACLLLGLGRRAVTDREQEFIRQALFRHRSLLWSDACCGEYGPRGREILCNLVLRGVLTIDLNLPISPNTRFVSSKGDF